MRHLAVLAFLALATPAAAKPMPPAAPAAPNARLKTVPLTLRTATGAHRYTVEVAATAREQEVGLMFRRAMPRRHGMIFPMFPARPASFWMRNTYLPLDIVFIAPGNEVLTVAANAQPLSESLIDSGGPVVAVLELNAGEAARIGLKPGDRVDWRMPGR